MGSVRVLLVLLAASGCQLGVDGREQCSGATCPTAQDAAPVAPDASPAPPPDAAAAEEVAVPDAAPPALLACDDQFGAVAGYQLCSEEPTGCEFFAQTSGATCADTCAAYASECLNAWDATGTAPCVRETEDGCLAVHSTQICLCTRATQGLSTPGG